MLHPMSVIDEPVLGYVITTSFALLERAVLKAENPFRVEGLLEHCVEPFGRGLTVEELGGVIAKALRVVLEVPHLGLEGGRGGAKKKGEESKGKITGLGRSDGRAGVGASGVQGSRPGDGRVLYSQ